MEGSTVPLLEILPLDEAGIRGPSGPSTRESPHIRPPVPSGVQGGTYRCSSPLIRPSRLTTRARGGVGKDLSQGWCLNFAVGCIHGCPFCYVDGIHKRFGEWRYGRAVRRDWGSYFLIPSNLDAAIDSTPWANWRGKEVMMSSTHDPYLAQLAPAAGRILERALPAGVRFCIQTRSTLVLRNLSLLQEYGEQVRLQVSVPSLEAGFCRLIEPRVPQPKARIDVIKKAAAAGLRTGVIIAPVFPPVQARPDPASDLNHLLEELGNIRPDRIFGESLHVRGNNRRLLAKALGEDVTYSPDFDARMGRLFTIGLKARHLQGTWWYEHRGHSGRRRAGTRVAKRPSGPLRQEGAFHRR